MNIHIRLKDLRQAKKLSLQEAGLAIGVSWQTIQQWENGSTAPKRKRLQDVADFYGVTPTYLMYGNEVGTQETIDDLALIPMMDLKLSAGTGNIVFAIEEAKRIAFRTDYLRKRRVKPENAMGFPISGDSMCDVGINHGGICILNRAIVEPAKNKYYGMWIDGEYLIKEIVKRDDMFYAVSHNDKKKHLYPDIPVDSDNSGIIGQAFYCGFEL